MESLEIDNKQLHPRTELAKIYQHQGKYDEAEKILDDGVQRFPDSASMWQNLSFLHAKLGNKDKAEEYYEKSKQLRDN